MLRNLSCGPAFLGGSPISYNQDYFWVDLLSDYFGGSNLYLQQEETEMRQVSAETAERETALGQGSERLSAVWILVSQASHNWGKKTWVLHDMWAEPLLERSPLLVHLECFCWPDFGEKMNSFQFCFLPEPQQENQGNVKFVQDTSKFWYKPHLSREQGTFPSGFAWFGSI